METSTYYRKRKPKQLAFRFRSKGSPQELSQIEKKQVLAAMQSERFMDQAVREVHATLWDEGIYYCSVSSMYRILREHDQVKERRNQARRKNHERPVLIATAPNQVYTWDITKLRGLEKGVWYSLYVVIDIFSRCIVGWTAAEKECQHLAAALLEETCRKQNTSRNTLTLHADNGGPMISKTVANLLVDLGVIRSHSRPHVSNDNAYSEAHFKTVKYCPQFPGTFGSLEEVRAFFRKFASFYNEEHHHSGIAYLTPEVVHCGRAEEVLAKRQAALDACYLANPVRYRNRPPKVRQLPKEVRINRIVDSKASVSAS